MISTITGKRLTPEEERRILGRPSGTDAMPTQLPWAPGGAPLPQAPATMPQTAQPNPVAGPSINPNLLMGGMGLPPALMQQLQGVPQVGGPNVPGLMAGATADFGPQGSYTQALADLHSTVQGAQGQADQAWGAVQGAMDAPAAQPDAAAEFATRLAGNLSQAIAPGMNGQQAAENHIQRQANALKDRQIMRLQLLEKHSDMLAERAMRLGDTEAAAKLHAQGQKHAAELQVLLTGAQLKQSAQSTNADLRQRRDLALLGHQTQMASQIISYNGSDTAIEKGVFMGMDPTTGQVTLQTRADNPWAGFINPNTKAKNASDLQGMLANVKTREEAGQLLTYQDQLEMTPVIGEDAKKYFTRTWSYIRPVAKGFLSMGGPIGANDRVRPAAGGKKIQDVDEVKDKPAYAMEVAHRLGLTDPQAAAFYRSIGLKAVPRESN